MKYIKIALFVVALVCVYNQAIAADVFGDLNVHGKITASDGATLGGDSSTITGTPSLDYLSFDTDGLPCIGGAGGTNDVDFCAKVDDEDFNGKQVLVGSSISGGMLRPYVGFGLTSRTSTITDGVVLINDFAVMSEPAAFAWAYLPIFSADYTGQVLAVKSGGPGSTIIRDQTGTIDGESSYVMKEGESVILQNDGSEYRVIASHNPFSFETLTSSGDISQNIDLWYLDSSSGAVIGTLPSSPSAVKEPTYIKAVGGAGKINSNGKTIDGVLYGSGTELDLADDDAILIHYDGTGWNIL